MNQQDELVDLIAQNIAEAADRFAYFDYESAAEAVLDGRFNLRVIADAILAAGYVKADGEEWAVRGDNPEPWFQDAMISSRDDAEAVACNYRSGRFSPGDSGARVVRRLVGSWEAS